MGTMFRAIAPVSGLIGDYSGVLVPIDSYTDCQPLSTVAIWSFHGDSDQIVPYVGGSSPNPFDNAEWYSFEDSMQIWRNVHSCNSNDDYVVEESSTTSCTYNTGCDVVKCVVSGLGHAWPGANSERNNDVDATEMIVNFFLEQGA